MKEHFNPIHGEKGEFRVALNLSEVGDRAWELLSFSQELGFNQPRFATHVRSSGVVEVWAVLLQQFHDYNADTRFVDGWDDSLDRLRSAVGNDNELNLIVLCNFAEYLEPVEYAA
jgi:hypothetical protein